MFVSLCVRCEIHVERRSSQYFSCCLQFIPKQRKHVADKNWVHGFALANGVTRRGKSLLRCVDLVAHFRLAVARFTFGSLIAWTQKKSSRALIAQQHSVRMIAVLFCDVRRWLQSIVCWNSLFVARFLWQISFSLCFPSAKAHDDNNIQKNSMLYSTMLCSTRL